MSLLDYFKAGDTETKKTVYCVLITRRSFANPLQADGFKVQVIASDNKEALFSFGDLENLFEWLGGALVGGFWETDGVKVREKLWDTLK